MKFKIGDIEISEIDRFDEPQYSFVLVVHQTYHSMGIYKSIEEGVTNILETANGLRPKDRADLERLQKLLDEKNGDLKEVRKALIEAE